MGSLPKRHGGCSRFFFQLSVTPGLSHFYPDTNGKYSPGLISTDQRYFLKREEPQSPGRGRSPRGNYLPEGTWDTTHVQWHSPRADGAHQDSIPESQDTAPQVRTPSHQPGQAVIPFSSPINLPNEKLAVHHVRAGSTLTLRSPFAAPNPLPRLLP